MRSSWKGCFFKSDNTLSNSSVILNTTFKKKFLVYDGKHIKNFFIRRFMLGLKVGEFVFTKKMGVIHKKKKNIRVKKK